MAVRLLCCVCVLYLIIITTTCFAVTLHEYLPLLELGEGSRESYIQKYFNLGFPYEEILVFLSKFHAIILSLRQLKRLLKTMGLRRRKVCSSVYEVVSEVERELRGSGSSIGYRAMHKRLTVDYNLVTDRETVRQVLKIVDPAGVQRRSKHRLKRRSYKVKGPNYIWHVDGYDKLKPFGFCIHGALDGYSRRVLWLEVGPSNNDPKVVGQYYIDYIRQIGGAPRIVRADCGTENVHIAAMQRYFRSSADDDFAGDKSFMYGKSTSNQRIEAWWSQLRRSGSDWWIKYFKDLRDSGIYRDGQIMDEQCLKFCYNNIIKDELYKVARHWNIHCIRPSTNAESPSGRPDTLYFLPEVNETRDYKTGASVADIDVAEEMCCMQNPPNGCEPEFNELAAIIMRENRLQMPTTVDEAEQLYVELLHQIEST